MSMSVAYNSLSPYNANLNFIIFFRSCNISSGNCQFIQSSHYLTGRLAEFRGVYKWIISLRRNSMWERSKEVVLV